jgi:hypothetical protein
MKKNPIENKNKINKKKANGRGRESYSHVSLDGQVQWDVEASQRAAVDDDVDRLDRLHALLQVNRGHSRAKKKRNMNQIDIQIEMKSKHEALPR